MTATYRAALQEAEVRAMILKQKDYYNFIPVKQYWDAKPFLGYYNNIVQFVLLCLKFYYLSLLNKMLKLNHFVFSNAVGYAIVQYKILYYIKTSDSPTFYETYKLLI